MNYEMLLVTHEANVLCKKSPGDSMVISHLHSFLHSKKAISSHANAKTKKDKASANSPTSAKTWPQTSTNAEILH